MTLPLGAVTEANAVFRRENGDTTATFSDATFEPIFYDEATSAQKTEAEAVCGGADNIACIFDYIATNNSALALATKASDDNFVAEEAVLSEWLYYAVNPSLTLI